jgi:pyrroloquinoline quinone biosynthesis protein B
MQARILILGAGQDGGSPQLGNRAGVGPVRRASSVAVVSKLGSVVLLDASPDIRAQGQTLLEWSDYPSDRETLLDAVAITHGHMGHYAGLLHLGKESANTAGLRLIATPSFHSFVASNEPWNSLVTNGNVLPVPLTGQVTIDESLSIVGIPVPHRAEHTDTVGLSIISDGVPQFFYLPDIDGWEHWPDADSVLSAHKASLIDATFSSLDELPNRDMHEIRHPLVRDTVERFSHLTAASRIILGHINHTNRLADATSEVARNAKLAGFDIAFDGLSIVL